MDLTGPGNNFDVAKLKRELDCHVDFHDVADSTNDLGLKLAQGNTRLPAIVLARQQVAGRGQPGKRWHSDHGSLTYSIVMRLPPVNPSSPTKVSEPSPNASGPQPEMGRETYASGMFPLHVGLRVCEALEAFSLAAELKWPNDIFFGRKKAGGILVETTHRDAETIYVVGIGLNVNNEPASIPVAKRTPPESTPLEFVADESSTRSDHLPEQDEDAPSRPSMFAPTSLSMETGQPLNLTNVAIGVARSVLRAGMTSTHPTTLADQIFDRLAFRNKVVRWQHPNGETLSGKCVGVAESGGLQIQVNDTTIEICSGSIVDF